MSANSTDRERVICESSEPVRWTSCNLRWRGSRRRPVRSALTQALQRRAETAASESARPVSHWHCMSQLTGEQRRRANVRARTRLHNNSPSSRLHDSIIIIVALEQEYLRVGPQRPFSSHYFALLLSSKSFKPPPPPQPSSRASSEGSYRGILSLFICDEAQVGTPLFCPTRSHKPTD